MRQSDEDTSATAKITFWELGDVALLVEGLPSMRKSWVQSQHHKLNTVAGVYHPSTQEVETGGSEVQSHPQLYSKFKASVGCVTTYVLGLLLM